MTLNQSERYNLVITCIVDHPKAMTLLRTARSRAQDMGGAWRAVFIETPEHLERIEDGSQQRILRLLTLAEQMGGGGSAFNL